MLSGRYWSHIQNFHEFIKRTFWIFSARLVQTLQMTNFQYCEISHNTIFENDSGFSWFILAQIQMDKRVFDNDLVEEDEECIRTIIESAGDRKF